MEKTKTENEKKLNPKTEITKHVESSYTRFPNRALSDDRLIQKDILVLLAICSFLNNKKGLGYNTCYPSRSSIAKKAGFVQAHTVDESISNLEKYGYIVKEKRRRGEKANASNVYKVIFAAAKMNPDAKESPKRQSIRKAIEQIEIKEAKIAPVVPEPVAPAETPKPVKKVVRKKKAPIDEQELSKRREQAIELINSWNYTLRQNEYTHHEEENEKNISYAIKALEQYDLPYLKELAEHIWGGEWTRPKGIRAININIFNSDALMNSIIQSYETQIKETADRNKHNPKALREWRDPDEKSKSKAYIVRPRTYIE